MLSLPIQISVLTQEKKSLPTKSDKSNGRTPTGESAETAKAGNYSLSLERVLFKFGWVVFFFFFNVENKKWPLTATAHCSPLHNWQTLKFPPKPTRKSCAPVITHCNVKPDSERMATADLGKTAVIFNHQSRPSATVLQKHMKFMDSKASYKLPGAEGQLHCPRVHWGCLLHSLQARVLNKRHHAHIFCAKPGTRRVLLLD